MLVDTTIRNGTGFAYDLAKVTTLRKLRREEGGENLEAPGPNPMGCEAEITDYSRTLLFPAWRTRSYGFDIEVEA